MTKFQRHIIQLILGLVAASAVQAQEKLVVLSPHWEGIRYEFEEAFKRYYQERTTRSLEFVWLDVGATSEIIRFVESEFKRKPAGINVDLVFGGGTEPYEQFKRERLLLPYSVPNEILSDLPKQVAGVPLYDPEHTWYATTLTAFGILCNRMVLERLKLPVPNTWDDLTQPDFAGWLTLADPRKSGSAHMAYEVILQAYGWERGWQILYGLAANARVFAANSSQVPKDVADGEAACGLVIDSYAWAQIREVGEEQLVFILPQGLTVLNGDGIGILTGAPHPQTAEMFVAYMLSAQAQRLWLYKAGVPQGPQRYEIGRLALLPKLYENLAGISNVYFNPFGWHSKVHYDSALGSLRWHVLNDVLGTFLIEPHSTIVERWQAMRSVKQRGQERPPLPAAAPLREAEITRLAEGGSWSNPIIKSRIIKSWKESAQNERPSYSRSSYLASVVPALLLIIVAIGILWRRFRISITTRRSLQKIKSVERKLL